MTQCGVAVVHVWQTSRSNVVEETDHSLSVLSTQRLPFMNFLRLPSQDILNESGHVYVLCREVLLTALIFIIVTEDCLTVALPYLTLQCM